MSEQVWDLFENKHMFHALDKNQTSSATHHVAEMVAYLGLPPLEYIPRMSLMNTVSDYTDHPS